MFSYPTLSALEQAHLPAVMAAPTIMPAKFEDSTHQLWHCETVDGPMVLKVCDRKTVRQSAFWLGLNTLFGLQFPNHLGDTITTAKLLDKIGHLRIPEVIAAQDKRFVLTRFLAGEDIEADQVTDANVVQLAQHIGQLHQQRFEQWGDLHTPNFAAETWGERLHKTLQALAKQHQPALPSQLLASVLAEAAKIEKTELVPLMLDLRWDQLRLLETGELALIDLDAFVIGPRALELVLIMYLLTPAQFKLFKQRYCTLNDWPALAQQKSAYQLLLFLMHVLGETDVARWMQKI